MNSSAPSGAWLQQAEQIRERAAAAYHEERIRDLAIKISKQFAEAADRHGLTPAEALAVNAAVTMFNVSTIRDLAREQAHDGGPFPRSVVRAHELLCVAALPNVMPDWRECGEVG